MAESGNGHGLAVRLVQRAPVHLDVAFACGGNELLALVGASGAGKTTVLRAIAGLDRSIGGEIRADGETWLSSERGIFVPPQERGVGLVFQDYALVPHLSALGNVGLALGDLPAGEREAAARSYLRRVNLEEIAERRPPQLSGGERQRVALARALARRPRVLLLDEPFSAVDRPVRESLKAELALLRASLEIPIVLVTHDISEALALADRISVLEGGRTLATGAPEEMRLAPADPTVARLMGNDNLFPAVVDAVAAQGRAGAVRVGGFRLACARTADFPAGAAVTCLIPPDAVTFLPEGREAAALAPGRVDGEVEAIARQGAECVLAVALGGSGGPVVRFKIWSREIAPRALSRGARVAVSIDAAGIHLMRPVS